MEYEDGGWRTEDGGRRMSMEDEDGGKCGKREVMEESRQAKNPTHGSRWKYKDKGQGQGMSRTIYVCYTLFFI